MSHRRTGESPVLLLQIELPESVSTDSYVPVHSSAHTPENKAQGIKDKQWQI